jgi:hypothetical protein
MSKVYLIDMIIRLRISKENKKEVSEIRKKEAIKECCLVFQGGQKVEDLPNQASQWPQEVLVQVATK